MSTTMHPRPRCLRRRLPLSPLLLSLLFIPADAFASRRRSWCAFLSPIEQAQLRHRFPIRSLTGSRILRTVLHADRRTKWDDLVDDEDEEGPLPIPNDMRYIPPNLIRQNEIYQKIQEAGGKEVINDVYVRDPSTTTWWFVGKVAGISDILPEQTILRQYNLITSHALNIRPRELLPVKDFLEVWYAPGDSELDVAYNRPNIKFEKVETSRADGLVLKKMKSALCGFRGEVYEKDEPGFRTTRTEDGFAAKSEIQGMPTMDESSGRKSIDGLAVDEAPPPVDGMKQSPPNEEEMKGLMELLEGMKDGEASRGGKIEMEEKDRSSEGDTGKVGELETGWEENEKDV